MPWPGDLTGFPVILPGLFTPLSVIKQLSAAVGGNYECKISQNALCLQNPVQGVGDK